MNQKDRWLKLDNAGKIFPATSGRHNTGVFRFSCTLSEPVRASELQAALERTLQDFPHFLYVLRNGLFWYYLEPSELRPVCHVENTGVCSQLFYRNQRNLLFDVSYYECRINIEVYHTLTDGTGAMHFFRQLLCHYLAKVHSGCLHGEPMAEIPFAPASVRTEDSFMKYYRPVKKEKSVFPKHVYHLSGEPAPHYTVVEGLMSCKTVHALAKERGVTITAFLCAFLILAIHQSMEANESDQPIVVNIPVNLRNYFASETMRNFFGNIRIGYHFHSDKDTIDEILHVLQNSFHTELTRDKLMRIISGYVSIERNPLVKVVPLAVKNLFLRLARWYMSAKETIVVSNVGVIKFPLEFQQYIQHMSVFSSTDKIQTCICTCGDVLSVCFSSRFEETDIQRNFFRMLTDLGIEVRIESNIPE